MRSKRECIFLSINGHCDVSKNVFLTSRFIRSCQFSSFFFCDGSPLVSVSISVGVRLTPFKNAWKLRPIRRVISQDVLNRQFFQNVRDMR